MEYIKFKCIEVNQPIGQFYIGAINAKDLLDISYSDVRRIEKEQRDIETYLGIQRPLNPKRVKEIGKYANLIDATFPTSIIIAVDQVNEELSTDENTVYNAIFDEDNNTMKILKNPKIAKIIDGQHRIAGLENFEGVFQLNISLFIDMDIENQAMVFATINDKQTKVNRSIVADLYSLNKKRSPQKTSSHIVRLLNDDVDSPFYGKIKILGTANDKEKETITQATFVQNILKYMSKDPMTDRDKIKRGKKLHKVDGSEAERYFLRNMFIEEQDVRIAKIIWNYFEAVKEKWPTAWVEVEKEFILNKSTGFIALMRFLKDAYLYKYKGDGTLVSKDEFSELFNMISIEEKDLNRGQYVPGSGGQSQLYKDFKEMTGL